MELSSALIKGFVGSLLQKNFDEATQIPKFHEELWDLACSDDKFIAVAAPRGHAKSTAGTIAFTLASVLFRVNDYVLVVSDTETQAAQFVQGIKQAFAEDEDIIELFGLKKTEKGVSFLVENQSEIIVEFVDGKKFRISAKGAGQSLRGLLWEGKRPNLIVIDDLENDELVMNSDRRDKLERWFMGALIPMLSPRGKLRMWGTILHSDSLLEKRMPSERAKTTIIEGLKMYSTVKKGGWRSVKYKAHNEDHTEYLWPERFGQEFFEERYAQYKENGLTDVYAMEFLNQPIDESVAFFRKGDFLPLTPEDEEKALTLYITGDLAISEKERADYSVFVVGGLDSQRVLHIIDVIKARLDGREIVDTILALQDRYDPEAFGIEEMQVSQAIGPFLREEMIKRNIFPSLVTLKHMGKDKIQRARAIQARVRAKSVKFDKDADWWLDFETECLRFPKAAHDDQVDAFAYLGMLLDKMVQAPSIDELEEEEYEQELRDTGPLMSGRSAITGY